jgi:type IV secretory pathway TrbL component
MTEEKKQVAVVILVIWLLLVIFFMILAQTLSLEIFFVLWLIGLLVIVEFIGPSYVQPAYIRYLKYLITIGIIIFGAIVAQKVMEILNS